MFEGSLQFGTIYSIYTIVKIQGKYMTKTSRNI